MQKHSMHSRIAQQSRIPRLRESAPAQGYDARHSALQLSQHALQCFALGAAKLGFAGVAKNCRHAAALPALDPVVEIFEVPVQALAQSAADKAMANMPGMDHSKTPGMPGMSMPDLPKNANQIPLFPQDAFMEGPMMAIDKEVDKPETYGLPAGWSGFIGGMMTLVRVLPPDQYDKIMDLKSKQREQQ